MQPSLIQPRIASFGKCRGRLSKSKIEALDNLSSTYLLNPQEKFSQEIFANQNPLWLDIGFGTGESTISFATSNPDANIIGIEVFRSGVAILLKKLKQFALSNVRIYNLDIVELIVSGVFDKIQFEKIFILHPDPWPKRRHFKRRLLQAQFLDTMAEKLAHQGIIEIQTDDKSYSEFIETQLLKTKNLLATKSDLIIPVTRYSSKHQTQTNYHHSLKHK